MRVASNASPTAALPIRGWLSEERRPVLVASNASPTAALPIRGVGVSCCVGSAILFCVLLTWLSADNGVLCLRYTCVIVVVVGGDRSWRWW